MIGVLQQVERLGDPAGAEVDGEHRLDTGPAGPLDELVDADLVGLDGAPGEVAPHRTGVTRADAVLPAVVGDEVAAGIAHHRDAELLGEGEDVAAEPVLVRRGVVGLVDPGVHAAPEVLDERAEQPTLDRPDPPRGIDHDTGGERGLLAHDCDLRCSARRSIVNVHNGLVNPRPPAESDVATVGRWPTVGACTGLPTRLRRQVAHLARCARITASLWSALPVRGEGRVAREPES